MRTQSDHTRKSTNGWNWTKIADLDYRYEANELVIAIPMEAIHIDDPKRFSLEFKWIDNAVEEGDIQECLSDGDAAPNGRFGTTIDSSKQANNKTYLLLL